MILCSWKILDRDKEEVGKLTILMKLEFRIYTTIKPQLLLFLYFFKLMVKENTHSLHVSWLNKINMINTKVKFHHDTQNNSEQQ